MKTRTRLWVAPGLVFLLFLITAWIADRALDPEGGPAWALWTGLIVLGLTTAFVVFRFLSKRWRGRIRREEQAAKEDRIAHAFLTAD